MQILSEKSDYMRIRRYIVNTIATHAPCPVKFPSTRKLAAKFGVSSPTVLRVIRSLIEIHYLEPCKGGGTISIPRILGEKERKIFGFINAAGCHTYDDLYFNSIAAAAKLEISRRSTFFVTTQLNYEIPEELDRVLSDNSISYLALLCPDDSTIRAVTQHKPFEIPVVSFMVPIPGFSSVHMSYPDVIRESLRTLFAEGKRKILLFAWQDRSFSGNLQEEIETACSEAGVPVSCVELQPVTITNSPDKIHKALEPRLQAGEKFDGAIFYPLYDYYRLLSNYLDLKKECLCVVDYRGVTADLDYEGYVIKQDLEQGARDLADLLLNPPEKPAHKKIRFQLLKYKESEDHKK